MMSRKKGTEKALSKLIVRLTVFAFLIYSVVMVTSKQLELKEKKQQLAELSAKCTEQKLENDELERIFSSGDDLSYIEKIAREKLGYVYPDETVYLDISGK